MSQLLEKNDQLPGKSLKRIFFYVALVFVALIWFTPVITLVLTALKDAGDFAVNGAFSLPKSIQWSNFSDAWQAGVWRRLR
jgi:raffinose/stachyose/melibiose transport system permease protein